jgi:phage-related protein
MAFDGSTGSCWTPDVPIQTARTPRLRIARFGDGYQQRTLDGINSLDTKWSLNFTSRPADVIAAMDNYLAARQGDAFEFLDPVTGVTTFVFCDEWQIGWEVRRPAKGGQPALYYGTLSAEFYTANGVAIAG